MYDTGTGYPGGPANWGTGEVQTYTNNQVNVFQEDGFLHIRALHSGINPVQGWTSGRIETVKADFQPPAGGGLAVEARIQLPTLGGAAAQGYWPAFWMLGAPYRGNYWNWPGVGEIDILENINGLNQWWGALHCGTNPGGPCSEPSGIGTSQAGFSPGLQESFHTYRMEFDKSVTPQQLRWYVDGTQRFMVSANQVDATTWNEATNHGFFILLNVAIGGGWAGNPASATASGGTMLVDYVRVYAWPLHSNYLPLVTGQ
jgi:beta-glucanase (GH16 family)